MTTAIALNFTNRNGVPVMSSLELAALCVGDKKDAHSDFMKKAKKVLKERVLNFAEPSEYTSGNGTVRTRQILWLPEEEAYLLYNSYKNKLRYPLGEREDLVLQGVEWVLGYALERQYRVGAYRVDGYDPHTNTVYEVDEAQHKRAAVQEADQERQRFIVEQLGCKFKRINV